MSSVLNKLNSGRLINSVSKNFINWSSINENTFQDIVGKIIFLMDKTLPNDNSKYQALTIRIYSDDKNLISAAQSVIDKFVAYGLSKDKIVGGSIADIKANKLSTNTPMIIDLDDKKQTKAVRNASSQAWNYGKELRKTSKVATGSSPIGIDKETFEAKINIQKCIIDIWIEDNVITTDKSIQSQQKGLTQNITQSQDGTNTINSLKFQEMLKTYNKIKNATNLDNYITTVTVGEDG
jgi:hypothetical protein